VQFTIVQKYYKGGSVNSGVNVILEGVDLSGNGHGFSGDALLLHVRYFRKLREISKTDDFKNWLSNHSLFNLVKRYIIEKDQRWIDIAGTEAAIKDYINNN
jgi:hypothetical protein